MNPSKKKSGDVRIGKAFRRETKGHRPEVRHRLMEGGLPCSGAVLNELLDSIEDEVFALLSSFPGEIQPCNPEMGSMILEG